MTGPPLYKYLNIEGARLTLGNRCFKHAKPSTFNDTEDLTIRGLFPEDDETALAVIEINFTNILVKHLDEVPSCLNEAKRHSPCQTAIAQRVWSEPMFNSFAAVSLKQWTAYTSRKR
jgi:hypothetical protein